MSPTGPSARFRHLLLLPALLLTASAASGEAPAQQVTEAGAKAANGAVTLPRTSGEEEAPGMWRVREELFYETRTLPDGTIPRGALLRALQYRDTMPRASADDPSTLQQTVIGNRWVDIGPAPIVDPQGRHATGRIRAIAVDPTDPSGNHVYIGSTGGGIWETTDGGAHWTPISDFEASLAIQTLAIDPQDPRIIYAGTGELLAGAGVLKTTDGGRTWTRYGEAQFDYPEGGAQIAKVLPIPLPVANPATGRQLVLVGDNGIWKSKDGAKSWNQAITGTWTDAVLDPLDPSIVYAAGLLGIFRSTSYGDVGTWSKVTNVDGELPTSRFARINLAASVNLGTSTSLIFASMEDTYFGRGLKGVWQTADGGAHWTRVTGHPPRFADGTWVTPNVYESEGNDTPAAADPVVLNQVVQGTISPAGDVDWFRVTIIGNSLGVEILADRAHSGLDPVIRLFDAAGNPVKAVGTPMVGDGSISGTKDERLVMRDWLLLAPGQYLVSVEASAGATSGQYQLSVIGADTLCQCDYDQVLAVHPGNPNEIYLGQVRGQRSTDGGKNWTILGGTDPSQWIHVDQQAIVFVPGQTGRMYWGCDGGIFGTFDRGDHFTNLNATLSTAMPYRGMTQHPTDPGFLVIGTQDNGNAKYVDGTWRASGGADDCFTAIESRDVFYSAGFRGYIEKTIDGGEHWAPAVTGLDREDVTMTSPFVMAPGNPQVLIAAGGRRDLAGTPHFYVYRTTDGAASWSVNSTDLGAAISALAFSSTTSSIYYAGTLAGRVYRTVDTGAHWTDVTGPSPPSAGVSDIAVHPTDPYTAYVAYGGYGGGHLYRIQSGQAGWTDVSRLPHAVVALPDAPVNAIAVDPGYPSTVFAGGDAGMFRTLDGGVHWERFDFGLPNALVNELVLSSSAGPDGKMRLSTHGRGVWELRTGNDLCTDAELIGDGEYTGTTRGATADGASSCAGAADSRDVWYRYTASCDGNLVLDTCGSSVDTVVSVHTGYCPGSAVTELACNDDCLGVACGGPGTGSCVTTPVRAGSEYLIRVAGYGDAAGNFRLGVECEVPNDSCDDPEAVTALPAVLLGSTIGAGSDYAPTCDGVVDEAPGVWYTVVGDGNLRTASLCDVTNDFDTRLSVYCAGCGGLQCIAAGDNECATRSQVTWCAAPGQIYRVLVHGAGAETGSFRLDLAAGAYCGPLYLACNPGNDSCPLAETIGPFPFVVDNTNAGTDGSASCATSSADVWFRYEPVCHGWASFETCGATGALSDTVLSAQDGCYGREIWCNDDAGGECGLRSRIDMAMEAGRDILVRAASYGSTAAGTFPFDADVAVANVEAPFPGLYVVDGSGAYEDSLLRIDPFDVGHQYVGPTVLQGLSGLAYASNLGVMYAINNLIDLDQVVTVDLATGTATPFAEIGSSDIRSLAWDPLRLRLYGVELSASRLVEINPFTGQVRTIGSVGGYDRIEGLAFDPVTSTLYGADNASRQLVTIDIQTGVATAVGAFGGNFDRISGLAFDPDQRILYGVQDDAASGSGRLVHIDTGTGEAVQIGPSLGDLGPDGLEFVAGIADATAGKPYSAVIPIAGGCPAYTVLDPAGLPAGLSVDGSGRITGVPAAEGLSTTSFTAIDRRLPPGEVAASLPLRVRPSNDACADAWAAGDGTAAYSTRQAWTDGPREPAACSFFGDDDVSADVWFCYTAPCTGELQVDTCSADYDTKIAVYNGCACSTVAGAIACNDDACGTGSRLTIPVGAGAQYRIRVGGYALRRGLGTLALQCSGTLGGACCSAGACAPRTASECAGVGGVFLGEGSSCSTDRDGDGLPDACDACPDDPRKTSPGACGCGQSDGDSDADGAADCVDPDIDGDGVANVEDRAVQDRYQCLDTDGDTCDDCASGGFDPAADGPDTDADAVCDPGDCAPSNGALWHTPGEAGLVRFRRDRVTLVWQEPEDPGCLSGGILYDTLRADHPWDFPAGFCVESDDSGDQQAVDPIPPAAGQAWYYLVRAENGCGEGSLGRRSDGTERSGRPCP